MSDYLWIQFSRPRPSWYQLTDDEREHVYAALREVDSSVGNVDGVKLGQWSVRGQHRFSTATVWEFTSAEAIENYWSSQLAIRIPDYFEIENTLGSPITPRSISVPSITNWPQQ